MSDNKMDELQAELKARILREHPDYRGLWWWARRRIEKSDETHEIMRTGQVGQTTLKQSAVLVEYRGKTYFKRWGKLKA